MSKETFTQEDMEQAEALLEKVTKLNEELKNIECSAQSFVNAVKELIQIEKDTKKQLDFIRNKIKYIKEDK